MLQKFCGPALVGAFVLVSLASYLLAPDQDYRLATFVSSPAFYEESDRSETTSRPPGALEINEPVHEINEPVHSGKVEISEPVHAKLEINESVHAKACETSEPVHAKKPMNKPVHAKKATNKPANAKKPDPPKSRCPYAKSPGKPGSKEKFDAAFEAPPSFLLDEARIPATGCPKVYVYDSLPESWTIQDVRQLAEEKVFLPAIETKGNSMPALHQELQMSGSWKLYWRLLRDKRCHTEDPDKADLYLIPAFVRSEPLKYEMRPDHDPFNSLYRSCKGEEDENLKALVASLHHLSWETVHKHIFGLGGMSAFWFHQVCMKRNHTAQRLFNRSDSEEYLLLRSITLLSQEQAWPKVAIEDFNELGRLPSQWLCEEEATCNTVGYPYASSFLWDSGLDRIHSTKRPWVPSNHKRDIFLLFTGGVKFHGADLRSRGAMRRWCSDYDTKTANVSVPGFRVALLCEYWDPVRSMQNKLRARYCLEMLGDSVGRKSLSDDYATGCIPVLVGQAIALTFPQHWREWHKDAFLIFSRRKWNSRDLDPVAALQKVDDAKRHRIEANMAKFGSRFMWFKNDVPGFEDELYPILRSLWQHAEDSKKYGC